MKAFADSITYPSLLDNAKPEFSGRGVFTWNCTFGTVAAFSQKTAMRYRLIKKPGYILEYARYDKYTRQESTLSTTPTSTDYGASVWSSSWDLHLADNAKLEIGQAACWDPTIDNFFQTDQISGAATPDAAGLRSFLEGMKGIAELLD